MAAFSSLDEFRKLLGEMPISDEDAKAGALARNGQLTKPPGALGRLEDLAIWYAGWRGTDRPRVGKRQVVVFAGNHGVTAQGVSAFPAEVTVQMVANFQQGGAAVNQLSRVAGAEMSVHTLDLDRPTVDFTQGAAMNEEDVIAALLIGWNAVDADTEVLVVGEMGIGNTTSAAAISNALFGGEADDWTGRGTGVDDAGLINKTRVVAEGVARHGDADALEILRCLGGRELAAMAGAIASARAKRIPVILDGFICSAAAACLASAEKGALDHVVAGHLSEEGAHGKLLAALEKEPLLSLNMRLGEGSGATLAINILHAAVECHSSMATFEEAGVAAG